MPVPKFRVRARPLLVAATAWLIIGTVAAAFFGLPDRPLEVLAYAFGFASLVTASARLSQRRAVSILASFSDPTAVAARLADVIRRQWREESAVRFQLDGSFRVPWTATGAEGNERFPRRQRGISLVSAFQQSPHRRLVVLGPPGSGKSTLAVQLTLDLLELWTASDPVPVLMTLDSWNPYQEPFDQWFERRLVEDYPFLSHDGHEAPGMARQLVKKGHILFILDGLDEMSGSQRPAALADIARRVPRLQPLVLTSRSEEYEEALTSGVALEATTVYVQPLRVGDLVGVLERGSWAAPQWHTVLTHLQSEPDGPLAQALERPLFLSLALRVFADPARDPTGLLTLTSTHQIERWLLDHYLYSAYATSATAPWVPNAHRYSFNNARRWLTFLALNMTRLRTRSIQWPDLAASVPVALNRLLSASMLMAGTVLLAVEVVTFRTAMMAGLAVGAGSLLQQSRRRTGGALQPSGSRIIEPASFAIAAGVVLTETSGRWFGAVTAAAVGLMSLPSALDEARFRFTDEDLRQDPRTALTAAFRTVLVRFVTLTCAFAAPVVLLIMTDRYQAAELLIGLPSVVALAAVAAALGTSWWDIVLARCWLALSGRMPWRFLRFLDDAHQRGVLRQTGASYQFRHAQLQDHLAGIGATDRSDQPPRITGKLFAALSRQRETVLEDLPVRGIGGSR